MRWYPAAGVLIIALAGCISSRATEDCERVLDAYGAGHRLSGSFGSSVASIRGLVPVEIDPPHWPRANAQDYATLCYIDGLMGKAPPPGAARHDRFDRAAVGVWNGEVEVITLGYQTTLPVAPP